MDWFVYLGLVWAPLKPAFVYQYLPIFPHDKRPIASRKRLPNITRSSFFVSKRELHGSRPKFCPSNISLFSWKLRGSSDQEPAAKLSDDYPHCFHIFLKKNLDDLS